MEFNTLSLILCIALVVIGIVCFFIGITYRKKVAEKEIGSAEEEARRIINESIKGGENKKREMLLEAKEEIHKIAYRVREGSKRTPERNPEAGTQAPAEGRIARQEAGPSREERKRSWQRKPPASRTSRRRSPA